MLPYKPQGNNFPVIVGADSISVRRCCNNFCRGEHRSPANLHQTQKVLNKAVENMKIYEVQNREPLLDALVSVWEDSVRAIHHFLSCEEILKIKNYVPQALSGVEHLVIAENEAGRPIAFLGVENHRLEMLFLASAARGQGLGSQLMQFGDEHYGITELTVNEQNPQAVGFYEHLGFTTYKRTDYDEEGNPYPLLYMKRG